MADYAQNISEAKQLYDPAHPYPYAQTNSNGIVLYDPAHPYPYAQSRSDVVIIGIGAATVQTISDVALLNSTEAEEQTIFGELALDSTNTINATISSGVQRWLGPILGWQDIADLNIAIYADGIYLGVATTIGDVEYSVVGPAGPWVLITDVLTTDPAYTFPASGVPLGTFGVVPVRPDQWTSAAIWYRITVHVAGNPDMYAYSPASAWDLNIVPGTPASITVPLTNHDGTYSVSWAAVAGSSISYELQEDTDPLFGSPTSYFTAGLVQNFVLQPLGVYYYRIKSINPSNNSAWINAGNACIVSPPAAPATITVPLTAWAGLPYTVSWTAVPAITGYELQEDTDPLFGTPSSTLFPAGVLFSIITNVVGTYYYRVRAYNGILPTYASSWRVGANPIVVSIPIFPPAWIVVPVLGTPGVSYPIIWAAEVGITGYELQECTDPSFVGATSISVLAGTLSVSRTHTAGIFYYRIRSYLTFPVAVSTWLVAGNSCTVVLPAPTYLTVPSFAMAGDVYSVSWDCVLDADGYELQEDTDPAFGSCTSTLIPDGTLSFNVANTAGVYYYRVRAYKGVLNSSWTNGSNSCRVLSSMLSSGTNGSSGSRGDTIADVVSGDTPGPWVTGLFGEPI